MAAWALFLLAINSISYDNIVLTKVIYEIWCARLGNKHEQSDDQTRVSTVSPH